MNGFRSRLRPPSHTACLAHEDDGRARRAERGHPARTTCRWLVGWLLAGLALASDGFGAEHPDAPAHSGPAAVQRGTSPPRDDDFWIVSTRHLGCQTSPKGIGDELRFYRRDADHEWQPASRAELLASAAAPTFFYVHGNRSGWCEAIERGERFHHLVIGPTPTPRIRLVIWSWPSDRVRGLVRDARAKAARAEVEAHYLGGFLAELPAELPVRLVGYSFGACIITGALHDLAQPTGRSAEEPGDLRVAVLAAACDRTGLCPGGRHSLAPNLIDDLLVLYNPCDPVLKWFRFIDRCSRPAALGFSGLCDDIAASTAAEQINAGRWIGRTHDEQPYYATPALADALRRHLGLATDAVVAP